MLNGSNLATRGRGVARDDEKVADSMGRFFSRIPGSMNEPASYGNTPQPGPCPGLN
jgi:hypothetical protein